MVKTTGQNGETNELDGRRRQHGAIWPTLERLGWEIPYWEREGVEYRLVTSPWVPSLYSEGRTAPALKLSLAIHKRQTVLSLLEIARSGRSEEFLRDHSGLIEGITGAPPDVDKQAAWRMPGKGWAGSPDDWPSRLTTLESLVEELLPPLRLLGDAVAAAHVERLKTTIVELTIEVSSDGAKTVNKTSFWDRLRRNDGP